MRPIANDILQKYRTAIADVSIAAYDGDEEALEIYHAQKAYRRISKDKRKQGLNMFRQNEGRIPNFLDPLDLEILTGYGKLSGLGGSGN